jgi:glutamate synthase (NADPH/NADH) small chain
LAINTDPVTIESIEKAIVERGFEEGWIIAEPPPTRSGKKVAIVGSGPAGLAAAQQLNRAGHLVTVFERADYIGGLLVLGIPEFKMEKRIVERRVNLMREEGVEFRTGINVGIDLPTEKLQRDYDAVLLAGGSTLARDLNIPGRELAGIYPAVTFLSQQNRLIAGEQIPADQIISAKDKDVVVLGGGDTGSDCVGTSHRQGALSVHQFELLPEPPEQRRPDNPWPYWPMVMRTSSSQHEGGIRDYNILTQKFTGAAGDLQRLHAVRLDWGPPDKTGRPVMNEVPGSEFAIETQLVLLALGFISPEPNGMLADLEVRLDDRGNVAVDSNMMTNIPGVFAAGDMARGQSLIVWAIALGRDAAKGIDEFLMNSSVLPPSAATRTAITG